jgi:hypothetical protein
MEQEDELRDQLCHWGAWRVQGITDEGIKKISM